MALRDIKVKLRIKNAEEFKQKLKRTKELIEELTQTMSDLSGEDIKLSYESVKPEKAALLWIAWDYLPWN